MAAETQETSGYYVWEAPGTAVTIHLHLDVIERLAGEVMRGFGAVPKRGAEVGGVLIGSIERRKGEPAIIRIEDFETVECEYRRGPSYLFAGDERAVFADAVQRWQPDGARPAYAVGFYRSNTRDALTLAAEDLELLDEFFPDAESVALLIKPYGTKVSEAGFFVRENGHFPAQSPLQFPFRRYELMGEEPPPRRSLMEPHERRSAMESRERGRLRRMPQPARGEEAQDAPEDSAEELPRERFNRGPGSAYGVTLPPSRSRFGSSMWLPLSFVFLLFGVALGFMISMARNPKGAAAEAQNFSLGLAVSKSGDNLVVKWDPQAPAVRASQQGLMEIQDGANRKPVPLGTLELESGAITYTNSSNAVKFKLTVNPRAQVSISETAEWRP